MIKTVGIVSLSSGIIGESFIRFESDIGICRLKGYGLNVKFMPHALMGLDYIKAHPEKRAEDLLEAFRDPEIDMILCAIGGMILTACYRIYSIIMNLRKLLLTRFFSVFRIQRSTI